MNTKYILTGGFVSVIVLLLSLINYTLDFTNFATQHVSEIQQDDERVELVTEMLLITHERTNLVYDMSYTVDPFERDEKFIRFREIGSQFLNKITLLEKYALYDFETQYWGEIRPLLSEGGGLRNKAIEKIVEGKFADARKIIVDDLLPVQHKVTMRISQLLEQLQSVKKIEQSEVVQMTRSHYDSITNLAFFAVTLSLFVAAFVVQLIARFEKNLIVEREKAQLANKQKSQFLASMSHEIRTPLTSILGFTDYIKDSSELPDAFRQPLNTIHQSGKHLLELIRNVLDLSKIESNKLEVSPRKCSAVEIVEGISSQFEKSACDRGVQLITSFDFPFPKNVFTDPVRFRQVLLNLVGNAIKFSKPGTVHINASFDAKNEMMLVKVADNGQGICEDCDRSGNKSTEDCREKSAVLFQPYLQNHTDARNIENGTGLGLFISNQIANKLGGELRCECFPSRAGATFFLSLPTGKVDQMLQSVAEFDAKTQEQSTNSTMLDGRVLIVEDNDDLAGLLRLLLTQIGIKSDRVIDGEKAVSQAFNESYDAILMDKQMKNMDGVTATKLIREKGFEKAIIALSADVVKDNIKIFKEAGATDFIGKPFSSQTLYKRLSKYLPAKEKVSKSTFQNRSKAQQFRSLLEIYLKALGEKIEQMSSAIQSHHLDEIARIAHNIKGQGTSFGYPEITTLGREIESTLKKNDIDSTGSKIDQLKAFFENIRLDDNPILKSSAT